jgi:FKBP-type peptidyl-prolyl cis-trans isomerase
MLAVGDSANFIIDANNFFTKTINSKLPSFFKENDKMKVSAKLQEIIDSKTYEKQKREFLSWVEDFGEYEKILLQHYLDGQARSFSPENSGIYKELIRKGNGLNVERGDTVVVHYEGMFLSGKYFDSTRKRNTPFEFIYGTEWQVVEGLNKAIGQMTEGEKAMFILPSQLAFGNEGSSTGIIPPFTPVIFKVELVQVRKANKNGSLQ